VYGQGGPTQTANLEQLQAALDHARREVVSANDGLAAAAAREAQLRRASRRLYATVEDTELLSDRLAAQRRAVLFNVRVDDAHEATETARTKLEHAQAALDSAQQSAQAPSFAQGVGMLMGAPAYQSNYVFPVGGGPRLVSVGHTHHDYPAADIAAPAGSPVYALSNAVVLNAWHEADPRCGIGMTIRTQDGLTWTYCHLAYLEPSVTDGVTLAAGTAVGLVGSTGHATGPHLHLQLQPPTSYPQDQPWFQAFAGSAFTWQDAPTELELPDLPAPTRVFSVVPSSVPSSRDSALGFTRGGA
jgi:murein DD-endopeptidase MepM/ murein hydrolase activator NlpD